MELITDKKLLNQYINYYKIDKIFEQDMTSWMKLHYYQEGENIYSLDQEPDYFYFLVKGKLKVYILLENGKKVLLRFNKPLGIQGDLELMGDYKVKANVEAVSDSFLIGIKMKYIDQFAYDDSKFLRFVIEHLSHKLYTLSNAMALNLSYPLKNRLASYLISVTSDEDEIKRIEEIETNNLSELAALLGTSYRHLNRSLKKLSDQGIIKRSRSKIEIKNYQQLRDLSVGLYE